MGEMESRIWLDQHLNNNFKHKIQANKSFMTQ